MIKIAAAGIAAMALWQAGAPDWNWGDAGDEVAGSSEFGSSQAICRAVRGREPPAADRPGKAEAAALAGCDSEALLYGIGRAPDPVRARHCAFVEAEAEGTDGAPFGGRAMLMTIYANGAGVTRDLDVATNLACGIEGAAAESHGRVVHLQQLKAQGAAADAFHPCDDITSGLAMGFCADHGARIDGAKRAVAIAALSAGWSAAEKAALARLRAAQEAYAQARADGEVDASGTARGALWIAAKEEEAKGFLDTLERIAAGRAPGAEFAAADKALNAAYRARIAALRKEPSGTVTAEGVRDGQRAWLRYRDAFTAFAAVKSPSADRKRLAGWLTQQRTRALLGGEGA